MPKISSHHRLEAYMTRMADARIAGFTFLLYIAATILPMPNVRAGIGLELLCCFFALVLAATLYRITRDQDPTVAMLALTCRVGEGVLIASMLSTRLALQSLGPPIANAPDILAWHVLETFLLNARDWSTTLSATFFAVGSSLFCWLLLRGRMIPSILAWLGVIASVFLVTGLPLQITGVLFRPITLLMWVPMIVFEVAFALWLLIKGVAVPLQVQS